MTSGVPAAFGNGLSVTLTGSEVVKLTADQPDQLAGRGIAVHLVLRNLGSAPIDLSGVQVNAVGADGNVLDPTTGAPTATPAGSLVSGASISGTWAFSARSGGPSGDTVTVSSISSPAVVTLRL